jgi:RNA polymerase sigma factor (sigma-70 family)
MVSNDSVTQWIDGLKAQGDGIAVEKIWDRYGAKLLRLARDKLKAKGGNTRIGDEEDVVQSAFASFCRRAELGKFPKLNDRDNLWPLLIKITERKAADAAKREKTVKRGSGHVRGESALADSLSGGIDPEPTPELAAQSAEELSRLFAMLDNDTLRLVAIRKMEGYTTEEIATELNCSARTIKQKTALIRKIWEKEVQ